jgi:hypothetical protein
MVRLGGQSFDSPRITPEAITARKQDLALCMVMVAEVLRPGIDYGRIPGVPGQMLFESGASQIISAFNCFPGERRVLQFKNEDGQIAFCLEVPLINRATGRPAASGVGAASTLETKNKYRWVDNPQDWGFDDEATKTLKTKKQDGVTLFRIANPEPGELLNTLLKMASKRAEVDAAEALPGVSSALKQLLHPTSAGAGVQREDPWRPFWGEATRLGLTEQQVHERLGDALGRPIESVYEWLAEKHTIPEAIEVLRGRAKPASAIETEQEPETERDRLWSAIRSLIGKLKPTTASIVAWWKEKAGVIVEPSNFVESKAPQKMSDKDLQSFHDTLVDFDAKRSEQAPKKKR